MSQTALARQGPIGARIIRLAVIGSTSDTAKGLARRGAPHGTVVVAEEQTRGRGQRGRRWASPRGGLWASILVRPRGLGAEQVALLNVAAAVAAAEACAAVSGAAVRVKWPNDLIVGDRKVGGVLTEARVATGRVTWAVIGLGVNANVRPEHLPARLRGSAVSLLEVTGRQIALDDLLREACRRADGLLGLLERGRGDEVVARWRRLDATAGRAVCTRRDGVTRGLVAGIDSLGRLLVRGRDNVLITIATSGAIIIQ